MINKMRQNSLFPIHEKFAASSTRLARRARNLFDSDGKLSFGHLAAGRLVAAVFGHGECSSPIHASRPGGFFRRGPAWHRATAALEFAIATPMLVILLGGVADFGLAQYYRTNLANAVAAGSEYAYLTGISVTSSNIQTVVQNMMFLPTGAAANLSVNVTGPTGYCVTGSGPTMSAAAVPSTCSDGSSAGTYVIIAATYTNVGLMRGFLSANSQPITETATVRLN